jgi:pimeloyl-ACP methyl ester carboxylesterase
MNRHSFQHDGLALSFLDDDSAGRPLVALHAHWMEGLTYAPLAKALAPEWRVIAPDQRGHGHSDHTKTYSRDDYLSDLEALLDHLGLQRAILLGNSLGGVNAYQFAARYPDRVPALVIEDIGAEIDDDAGFVLKWAGTFKTREQLLARIELRMAPYLKDSIRQTAEGWRLAFNPEDMVLSQQSLNGDHWADWLATTCPALLIHGLDSPVTKQAQVDQMAARRPNTRLVSLNGGHILHLDSPGPFATAVRAFLESL